MLGIKVDKQSKLYFNNSAYTCSSWLNGDYNQGVVGKRGLKCKVTPGGGLKYYKVSDDIGCRKSTFLRVESYVHLALTPSPFMAILDKDENVYNYGRPLTILRYFYECMLKKQERHVLVQWITIVSCITWRYRPNSTISCIKLVVLYFPKYCLIIYFHEGINMPECSQPDLLRKN